MSRWMGIKARIRSIVAGRAGDRRFRDEFRFHLDMETERNIQRGMTHEEARRAALVAFGGVDWHAEELRDERGGRWFAAAWADVRYACRTLRRAPVFVLTATITLALGIGLNGIVFGTIDGLLFRTLPIERSDGLVALYGLREQTGQTETVGYEDYLDYRDQSGAFTDLAVTTGTPLNLQTGDHSDMVWGDLVSENYFTVLRMRPVIGRFFSRATAASADPVVVLSHDAWLHRFGGDTAVINRQIQLNGTRFTIIGVAPKGFHGVRRLAFWAEMWVPLGMYEVVRPGFGDLLHGRGNGWATVFGRMHEGWTMARTQAAASAFAQTLAFDHPESNAHRGAVVIPAGNGFDNPSYFPPQVITLASSLGLFAVSAILAIVCANLANLLLARAASRQQELGIRLSLGCSRARLVSQLLVEAAVLAVPGIVLGLVVAFAGPLLQEQLLPRLQFRVGFESAPNTRVLLYTLAVSIAAIVLFGLAPALGAARAELISSLKSAVGDAPRRSRRALGMRSTLVIVQLALSVVLLCGGTLFARSLRAARLADLEFDAVNRVVLSVNLDLQGYSKERGVSFYRNVRSQIGRLPSVDRAAWGFPLPFDTYYRSISLYVDGLTTNPDQRTVNVQMSVVDTGFFDVMGIRLLAGRALGVQDSVGAPLGMVINRSAAARLWPGVDPVGRRARLYEANGPEITVVGIAADAKFTSVSESPLSRVYLPLGQRYAGWETLIVRLRTRPTDRAIAELRAVMAAADPALPTFGVMTMEQGVRNGLNNSELAATLAGMFGLVALLIASVGLYGLVANNAVGRTREIGVRIALGATRTRVASLVIGGAARLATVGIALGLAGAIALGRVLGGLLVGMSPYDPATFIGVPLFLVLVVFVASYLPARRASRLDPARVLRS